MLLDEVLDRNSRYVSGRKPAPLPPPETVAAVVVACFDPRLDSMIPAALGLAPGDALVLRVPAAFVPPDSDLLRALMVALFLVDAREVIVVGHTSCRMASFETNQFIDAFRKRGVRREAFGTEDLREWARAVPSPRKGVELSVAAILASPVRPRDVAVSGLVLDDTMGSLELVAKQSVDAIGEAALGEDAAQEEVNVSDTEPPSEPDSSPEDEAVMSRVDPSLIAMADRLAEVLRSERRWGYEVGRLRKVLGGPGPPLVKLREIRDVARRVGVESQEALDALEKSESLDADELLELARHLVKRL